MLCRCDHCADVRAKIRDAALAQPVLTHETGPVESRMVRETWWADMSWDGPAAGFPGAHWSDER